MNSTVVVNALILSNAEKGRSFEARHMIYFDLMLPRMDEEARPRRKGLKHQISMNAAAMMDKVNHPPAKNGEVVFQHDASQRPIKGTSSVRISATVRSNTHSHRTRRSRDKPAEGTHCQVKLDLLYLGRSRAVTNLHPSSIVGDQQHCNGEKQAPQATGTALVQLPSHSKAVPATTLSTQAIRR